MVKIPSKIASRHQLKRIEYYPKSPVPILISVIEAGGVDTYELFFSYHHSKLVQLGQVKVFKNNLPVEYVSAATMRGGLTLEVIGKGDKLRGFELPFGEDECRLPLDLSKQSTHPLALSLRAAFKRFPPLPSLDRFEDHTPSSVLVETGSSITLSMNTGDKLQFKPECFFNVGDVQDDFLGCLFGPVGCAISVGIAVFLLCRTAR